MQTQNRIREMLYGALLTAMALLIPDRVSRLAPGAHSALFGYHRQPRSVHAGHDH